MREKKDISKQSLIAELEMQKKHFFYQKALIPFIPPGQKKVTRYREATYYRNCGIEVEVFISKGEKTREEHNKITHSINEWFVVYCTELVRESMENCNGIFKKVSEKNKEKLKLEDFSHCQLLYILRDKLAHNLYKSNSKSKEKGPYSAKEVSKEIRRRYGKNIDDFTLPIDKVIIPMIDGCILDIKTTL
jgi:hypothetical protein